MINLYRFIQLVKEYLLRKLLKHLPRFINSQIAGRGYAKYTPKGVEYIGTISLTKYKILANSSYAIENAACEKKFSSDKAEFGLMLISSLATNCIDVGANSGTSTLLMAEYCSGKILSFEPSPYIFKKLETNIDINYLNHRIIPFNFGLSDISERLEYFETVKPLGNGHLLQSGTSLNFTNKSHLIYPSVFVNCLPLDDFNYFDYLDGNIDTIKVDIETMESKFIHGAKKVIKKNLPNIMCETRRDSSYTQGKDVTTEIFSYLYSLNFRSYKIINRKFEQFIYPEFSNDTFFLNEKTVNKLSEQIIKIGDRKSL